MEPEATSLSGNCLLQLSVVCFKVTIAAPRRDDTNRRSSSALRGDLVQLRLLRMEEKHRSQLLYDQIRAFEDKVYLSYDQFNVDILYKMFTDLAKQTVVDVRRVKSINKLRQCFRDHKKMISCKLRHRHVKTTPQEEKVVKYFTWFFQYFRYLRELRDNFVNRVYAPLFKYFYNIGYDKPDRDGSSNSVMSSPSMTSLRSSDSGFSGVTGLTSLWADGDETNRSMGSLRDETHVARRKMVTKHALAVLGREFRDITKLYDTSELEKLAQRLAHLKERLDHLIDNESVVDGDLLCQDSERAVFHIKIRNIGAENLMRLVPDILIKCQKAAWLSRRWLERDDEKTKDLNEKLHKIRKLEESMNRRLSSLSSEIQHQEDELEKQSEVLNKLLLREERSNNLGHLTFELQKRRTLLQDQFRSLMEEKQQLTERLTQATNEKDMKLYRECRPLYERNKLKRFAVERQLATLSFHINLAEADLHVEIGLKSSVIHFTNDVQDRCEELEERIEKARKEQKVIQAALIPIAEDKKDIKERLQVREGLPIGGNKPAMKAKFVGTKPMQSDRIVDLNSEYLGPSRDRKPVSFFITAVPDVDEGTRVQQTTPLKGLSPVKRVQHNGPELMASEW